MTRKPIEMNNSAEQSSSDEEMPPLVARSPRRNRYRSPVRAAMGTRRATARAPDGTHRFILRTSFPATAEGTLSATFMCLSCRQLSRPQANVIPVVEAPVIPYWPEAQDVEMREDPRHLVAAGIQDPFAPFTASDPATIHYEPRDWAIICYQDTSTLSNKSI